MLGMVCCHLGVAIIPQLVLLQQIREVEPPVCIKFRQVGGRSAQEGMCVKTHMARWAPLPSNGSYLLLALPSVAQ